MLVTRIGLLLVTAIDPINLDLNLQVEFFSNDVQ